MASDGGRVAIDTTAALREGSVERLLASVRWLVDRDSAAGGDPRDLMLSLAVYVDCARRLGLDPAAAFPPLVASSADWVRDTLLRFVQRTDVTLGAFGWTLRDGPEGPAYRFAWPTFPPRQRPGPTHTG